MANEMKTVKGKGASGGLAKGRLYFYKRQQASVSKERCFSKAEELEKLRLAIDRAAEELEALERETEANLGKSEAEVFLIHRMMLADGEFLSALEGYLDEGYSAEYAALQGSRDLASLLAASEDEYMKAREADVRDVGDRILTALSGGHRQLLPKGARGVILCADDLSPGETVTLEKGRVVAFITAKGSGNSHTAILARSMGIPAIYGVGDALFSLPEGEEALVNGSDGALVIHPDEKTVAAFQKGEREAAQYRIFLESARGKRVFAPSGREILVYGNIAGSKEAADVVAADGSGVGLFRSEFLYLGRSEPPSEEEQYLAYKEALLTLGGKRVVIRTLDIGADKQVPYLGLPAEENPALGLRGIRLCLEEQSVFRCQLRALLRASVYGRLAILFPMIASRFEILQAKEILKEEAEGLEREGIPFSYDIEVGIMIETPAAALISDSLAAEVDFFSIGTNDLSQYTLAVDRQNPMAAAFFDPHHEAILKLVRMTVENAHKSGIWVGICGELAADPTLTEYFRTLEVDELSVVPCEILPLKARLLS